MQDLLWLLLCCLDVWFNKYNKSYDEGDDLDKRWMAEEGIGYVMPYTKRGRKVIENMGECLQAAINMSKELS